jgi:two-component system response regulator HydG
MGDLAVLVHRVARINVRVLLTGESGTGKEGVARTLHRASGRQGNFVPINCAALPGDLAESELFGYVPGAFTGAAKKEHPGAFRSADGGTLLLDEVGELPLPQQAKLLRVLEDGEVQSLGCTRVHKVDVRVVAATNRDLWKEVQGGRFREDLYYRLNVVNLRVPSLRERPEDIPLLVQHVLAKFTAEFGLDPVHASTALLDRLSQHSWPGNVRELENAVGSLVAKSPPSTLDLTQLPRFEKSPLVIPSDRPLTLDEAKRLAMEHAINEALRVAHGNKSQAARILKISRHQLSRVQRLLAGTDGGQDGDEDLLAESATP